MKKGIKIKWLVSIINLIILINYTTGLSLIYEVNLGWINSGIRILTYIVLSFSFIYFLKKIMSKKLTIIKENLLVIILIFSIMIITIIGKNFNKHTLIQCLTLIGTGFYSIYLINYYKPKELLKLIFSAQTIIVIFTIIFTNLYPDWGIMSYEGEFVWRGAFLHKNLLGANMAFGIIISMINYRISNNKIYRSFIIVTIIMSLSALMLTNSVTAVLIIIGALLYYMAYKVFKLTINPTYLIFLLHSVTYFLVINQEKYNEVFKKLFNRDLTLTGRTEVWKSTIDVIRPNWLFGYGFNNDIWGDYSPIAQYIRSKVGFNVTGAHNGLLEWALGIGVVGLVILIGVLIITGYRTIKIVKYNRDVFRFSMLYIFYILVFYISERGTDPLSYQILTLLIIIGLSSKYYYESKKYKAKS